MQLGRASVANDDETAYSIKKAYSISSTSETRNALLGFPRQIFPPFNTAHANCVLMETEISDFFLFVLLFLSLSLPYT